MRGNRGDAKNGHLARAALAIMRARTEFERARKAKDELDGGQAAEKAWLAVSEASKALLRLKGVARHKMPESHRGELVLLQRHGGADMAKSYVLIHAVLHADAFCRGLIDWDLAGETVGRAEGFVARVKQLATRN